MNIIYIYLYTVIVVSISFFICVRFSDSTFSDLLLLYFTHYRRYIQVYFYFICIVCIIFNSYALCNPYNNYVYIYIHAYLKMLDRICTYIYIHMHLWIETLKYTCNYISNRFHLRSYAQLSSGWDTIFFAAEQGDKRGGSG